LHKPTTGKFVPTQTSITKHGCPSFADWTDCCKPIWLIGGLPFGVKFANLSGGTPTPRDQEGHVDLVGAMVKGDYQVSLAPHSWRKQFCDAAASPAEAFAAGGADGRRNAALSSSRVAALDAVPRRLLVKMFEGEVEVPRFVKRSHETRPSSLQSSVSNTWGQEGSCGLAQFRSYFAYYLTARTW
jgi:hypothetical protein